VNLSAEDHVRLSALIAGRAPRNGRFRTVAVDGRGASGKTAFARHLGALVPGLTVVNGDDWFEPLAGEGAWGAFNEDRFARDVIGPLARGDDSYVQQTYDFEQGGLTPAGQVDTAGGVIVERCFSFALPVDWDLRIWVETPREVCLQRGIARDLMPAERVRRVWSTVWQPAEDAYIAGRRPLDEADVVIDGTVAFEEQVS
jgi:uridine kinase